MSNPTVKKIMDELEQHTSMQLPGEKVVYVSRMKLQKLLEQNIRDTGKRDDFAKAALTGLLASRPEVNDSYANIAYGYADEMMKAREL